MKQAQPEKQPTITRERLRAIYKYVRPNRGRLLLVLLCVLVTAAAGLVTPVFLEQAVDHALKPPFDLDYLWLICGMVAGVAVLRFVAGILQQYHLAFVTTRVLMRMRQQFFEKLQCLPMRFLSKTPTGEILTRMSRDLGEIQSVATGALLGLVTSVLTIVGTVALLVHYNVRLFALSLIVLPLAFLIARRFRHRITDQTRDIRSSQENVSSFLVESLHGMKFVRTHSREEREATRFHGIQKILNSRVLRLVMTQALGGGLPNLIITLAGMAVFCYGGWMVANFEEDIGDLIAFSILQTRLYGPAQGLIGLYLQVQRSMVSVDRIFEYLEMPSGAPDIEGASAMPPVRGDIAYEDVGFAYTEDRPLLRDISFKITAGEQLIIVGANGSGKTTLLDLLFRLHHLDSGVIRIDGVDIASIQRSTLNQQMAMVGQDAFLFHATIADNIRFARPDASDEDVANAAQMVGLGVAQERMPQGLATVVGERGTQLSGGERQKVSLARAILLQPRVLVLDEASAHLDLASDSGLIDRVQENLRGCTTLVVTHRLDKIRDDDDVLFLQDGQIAAHGQHCDLMSANGSYRAMHGGRRDA